MSAETIKLILDILKKGNSVEIKKEQGKIVIVEIKRKVQTKTSING